MLEQDLKRQEPSSPPAEPLMSKATSDALGDDELGEEDVPTVVLYIIAGLLFLSFTLYLIVGGGHSHFH